MGDYYDIEIRLIDGKEKQVFVYSNKNTNYNEVVVEMSESQYEMASEWQKKLDKLIIEKDLMIKSFLGL